MSRKVGRLPVVQPGLWGDWTRNRPGELAPIIRRNADEVEMIELVWGLKPRDPEHSPLINIRSDGHHFASHRCLVLATEFFFSTGPAKQSRWRFTMAGGGQFYFAGIWRPAREDWPEAYAVLTTAANHDVAPYSDRQMAVVPRYRRMEWLDHSTPEEELLQPLPTGSFEVELAR